MKLETNEKSASQFLEEIGKQMKRIAIRNAPIDFGMLRAQIDYRVEGDTLIFFCAAEYAEDMEYGKPPEPLSDVEKEQLKDWAERHGLPAWPVIRKIEREGIKVGSNKTIEMSHAGKTAAVNSPLQVPNGTYRPFMRPAIYQVLNELNKTL